MLSTTEILILIAVLLVVFSLSGVLSVLVIINYNKEVRKYPHEVVEISHDGFVYKLATGEIISVYKMKKRILKGFMYYIGTKDNILKYDDVSGKVSNGVNTELESGVFAPGPY
jgi:hypothetical protein